MATLRREAEAEAAAAGHGGKAKEPAGRWKDEVLRLVEYVPHGILMISDTRELTLLVPNLRLVMSSGGPSSPRHPSPERTRITTCYACRVETGPCLRTRVTQGGCLAPRTPRRPSFVAAVGNT